VDLPCSKAIKRSNNCYGAIANWAAVFRSAKRSLLANSGHSLRCNDLSVFGVMRLGVSHPPGLAALGPRGLSQLQLLWLWIAAGGGPLVTAHAAAKRCTTLERFRLTCQPTIFAGRHLAPD
jgi:hypothetical protein